MSIEKLSRRAGRTAQSGPAGSAYSSLSIEHSEESGREPADFANSFAALDGERPSLISPGNYDVTLIRYRTMLMYGRAPKLALEFRIVSFGEYFEQTIVCYYNVKKVIGRPAYSGRFKVGFHSDFLRDYALLFGAPLRLDRIPMSVFQSRILIARVRTVEIGSGQQVIPEGVRYSTIDALIGVKQ